jgi:fucose permease
MKNNSLLKILPVMFGFFIMGFVDIIGIATNYVKQDFPELTDSMANLLSLSCFLWFLIFSVPTGLLMNKIGRKKTVLLSFIIQIIALFIPVISYNFYVILLVFTAIGIGNTILQVSLNPLVTDVVNGGKLTGTLTLGQFIKSISSFLGPIFAGWASGTVWGWKYIFPIYALTSLIASVWLLLTPIPETKAQDKTVSAKETFAILRDKYILYFFIGILVLVAVDVSINISFPKLLMEKCNLELKEAGLGNSVYFFARMLGAFAGGILLMKYSDRKFFACSVFLALLGLIIMIPANNLWVILAGVVILGLGYANLFSIIFSLSLKKIPSKANEISALLIMGVSGGAILPPILGIITDYTHKQWVAILVIAVVWLYLVWLIKKIKSVTEEL